MKVVLSESQIDKVKNLLNNFLEDYNQQGVKRIEVTDDMDQEGKIILIIYVCMSFLEDKPKPGFLLMGMKQHLADYILDFLSIYVTVKSELQTC